MSDNQSPTPEEIEAQNKAAGKAFIRKLIIGKVILLIVLSGVGYYLYLTI